jgi:sulfur-oxidizing protein SoxA
MDPIMRVNWEAIEEFPPYMPTVEQGGVLWNTKFRNGKGYEYCFTGADIATNYPRWDRDSGEVETLPLAINRCRKANGEEPLKYGKQDMLALQAYVAYKSRGNPTNVLVPPDDPRALEAYQQGKKFYFSRRGQLNMACYHCHFDNAGSKVRANVLSPALGQTTHWPAYRSKWGSMGSLHRRYKGCNKQVRAKPFDFQSKEYRNLEYFHTFLSNGIPVNGPGSRF